MNKLITAYLRQKAFAQIPLLSTLSENFSSGNYARGLRKKILHQTMNKLVKISLSHIILTKQVNITDENTFYDCNLYT